MDEEFIPSVVISDNYLSGGNQKEFDYFPIRCNTNGMSSDRYTFIVIPIKFHIPSDQV